jgi:hypothetical protein
MGLRKKQIVVDAGGGQAIGDAIREAIVLSVENGCPVLLIHNERNVNIDPSDLITAAYAEWNSQSTERG